MRKTTLSLILGIILLVTLVYASELIPQGAINGVGLRRIYNFTNISTDNICDDLGTCVNTSKLIDIDDLTDVNTSLKSYVDTQDGLIRASITNNRTDIISLFSTNDTTLNNRDNAINDSDNIMNLFSAKVFYAQEFNGSMNSSNIKNTPAACSVSNTFMTEYAGASSTCTSVDFSSIEISKLNITDTINMTNRNITNVDCMIFSSGGKICTG